MITLPERFSKKLHADLGWEAIATSFINSTAPYLRQSPWFFPEFTEHGELHIDRVLKICDKLIPEKTMERIESRDLAVLIMAAVSHDLGMFLKEDGLRSLIYKEDGGGEFSRLFGGYWRNAWEQYLIVFKHYSEKKQKELFGSVLSIENLSKNKEAISEADKRIYGDFLRIHHPMLAYQIITCSFPGTSEYDIFTDINEMNQKPDKAALREIIGIIAQSHGSAIRDFDSQIQKKFGAQSTRAGKPLGIPIYYLMSILRIADLLDAGHDRAPYQAEHQQTPKSSVSQREYAWNQCVNYESYDWHIDREYLEITAHPKSTTFFIRIEEWINAIQNELDKCWAILGEQYGVGSDSFLLSIRRIYSNVTDEHGRKAFEESFLTKPAVLSADPQILHLLIGPLYRSDPSFGIREILQNAIDACNERSVYHASRTGEEYKPHISVSINTVSKEIAIYDNGIGMNADTVLKYYLVAGASFRSSIQWYREFAKDSHVAYARNGRFGIGVLAVFLLGNKVEVITRHVSEEKGLRFLLTHDNSNIDVETVENVPVGTSITVSTNEEVIKKLLRSNWKEWYVLDSPEVSYTVDNQEKKYEKYQIASWFSVNDTAFEQFRWKYCEKEADHEKILINGFPVTSTSKPTFRIPSIYIEDRNGDIEMDLSREKISFIPEMDRLNHEVHKYIVSRILSHNFHPYHNLNIPFPKLMLTIFGLGDFYFVFSKSGYTVLDVLDSDIREKIGSFSLYWNNTEQQYYRYIARIYSNGIQRESLHPIQYFVSIGEFVNYLLKFSKGKEMCILDIGDSTKSRVFSTSFPLTPVKYGNRNILKEVYCEYLGENFLIPYDYEERKKVCAEAFSKLIQFSPRES